MGTSSFYESRFGSIDQSKYLVGNQYYSYLRIKRNPFSFVSSIEFEHILIIPNTEENMNLIILLPKANIDLSDNMLPLIKSTINVTSIIIFLEYKTGRRGLTEDQEHLDSPVQDPANSASERHSIHGTQSRE